MDNQLLAPGPPPLTVQAADAAIDVIDFMAAVVRGVDLIDVTPAVREAWRAYLAAYYPMLNPADRYWFATAPYTLATIQAGWSQLPEEQRAMYRQYWATALPGLLQFIDPALHAGAMMPPAMPMGSYPPAGAYPPAAPQPAAAQAFDPPAYAGGPSASDLIAQIQGHQRESEQQALKDGGVELQQQVKLQNEAANIQMLSNISQMRFQSMMAIAKNMKW